MNRVKVFTCDPHLLEDEIEDWLATNCNINIISTSISKSQYSTATLVVYNIEQ